MRRIALVEARVKAAKVDQAIRILVNPVIMKNKKRLQSKSNRISAQS